MDGQNDFSLVKYDPGSDEDIAFLTMEQVCTLHRLGIEKYSPGEPLIVRDEGLLEFAVMAPQQTFDGLYLYTSLAGMAAAYMVGLAMNHPFENGNKRVAFAAGTTFLRMNGWRLTLSEDDGTKMIFDLVRHDLDREGLVALISTSVEPVM